MLESIRSILCHPQQERVDSPEAENAELESQRDDAESKLVRSGLSKRTLCYRTHKLVVPSGTRSDRLRVSSVFRTYR